VQQHVDAINARAVVRATTLLCADVRDDYPSAQVALALALLDGPPYADIDVGDARPTTVGGRDGFSVPLSLTVVADAATPVQLDVFVVDEYGWKLCSPELAGELDGTR
jgi:hypothetical protein